MLSTISEALEEIRDGRPVVVVDDENRENEGDLIIPAEKITPEVVNFMTKFGRGLVCAPVSGEIADRLNLPPMASKNEESCGCNFTVSIDGKEGVESGISAFDRAATISKICDPNSTAADFVRPGHIFPIRARDGGVLARDGHTEATVDLARMAGFRPAGVLCEVLNEDGTMARLPDLFKFTQKHGLKVVSIADLIAYRLQNEEIVERVAEADLPTQFGNFKVFAFRNKINPSEEHAALVFGDIENKKDVLVRVHSECVTSEVFGSLRCDCREQKDEALKRIAEEGSGVFLYLRQEGRGIGFCNKIRAYELQDDGRDTVEANEDLGLPADARDYGVGAKILANLGLSSIRLLTNNPKKIAGLSNFGLSISEQLPLESTPTEKNRDYLATKKMKLGHDLKQI